MYPGHTPACWLCLEWPLCFYHLNTVLSHLWPLWIKPKYMGLYLGSTYMIDFCEKLLWKRIIESGYFHTTLRRKLPKQRMAYLAAYWGCSQAMTGHHHGNVGWSCSSAYVLELPVENFLQWFCIYILELFYVITVASLAEAEKTYEYYLIWNNNLKMSHFRRQRLKEYYSSRTTPCFFEIVNRC